MSSVAPFRLPRINPIIGDPLSQYKKQEKQVIPIIGKFHRKFHNSTARHRLVWGGRNKGASWQIAMYLLDMAMKKPMFIPCVREIQKSTEKSVKKVLTDTCVRLGWDGFYRTYASHIKGKNGSEFIFLGLNDKTDDSIKSLEGADAAWVAESQSISRKSFDIFVPTIRGTKHAFIFWDLNPMLPSDPVYHDLLLHADISEDEIDSLYLTVLDNPFDLGVLTGDLKRSFRIDPKMAAHVWLGKLMPEDASSVLMVAAIETAMKNNIIPSDIAPIKIGADVAHKGGDEIVFYKRHGLKIIDKEFNRRLTSPVCARRLAEFSATPGYQKRDLEIVIDNGNIGAAIADILEENGWRVDRVNFGGKPSNTLHYANKITELYFEFSDIAYYCDIPRDSVLLDQLIDRRFKFVTGDSGEEKMRLESKDDFQKRKGQTHASPDRGDSLILTYKDALMLDSPIGLLGNRY